MLVHGVIQWSLETKPKERGHVSPRKIPFQGWNRVSSFRTCFCEGRDHDLELILYVDIPNLPKGYDSTTVVKRLCIQTPWSSCNPAMDLHLKLLKVQWCMRHNFVRRVVISSYESNVSTWSDLMEEVSNTSDISGNFCFLDKTATGHVYVFQIIVHKQEDPKFHRKPTTNIKWITSLMRKRAPRTLEHHLKPKSDHKGL